MNSSVHVDNKKKIAETLGKCPTQGLGDTAFTAEAGYSINFTEQERKFCFKSTLQWKQQFFIC